MDDRAQLRQAIAYLEAQRPQLGDAVVDVSTAALRAKLAFSTRPDEERRLVTVLFADLIGWSELAAAMDPEDLQAIQRAFFAAVTPPIEAHGGTVEKYIGDAVLAVFGVPEAHEDDAERAVRAALAIREAVAELQVAGGRGQVASGRLQVAGGRGQVMALPLATLPLATLPPATCNLPLATCPLQLRIGVHTGVVVSRVDSAGGFVVTGDMVNLAFRLQEVAAPGAVVVSDATWRLVAHAFAAESLGALCLRGRAEPVIAYRVLQPRPVPGRRRGLAGLQAPLVGREAELAALQQALQRLSAGQGGLAAIVGEAGIGKSRLVAELRKKAPAGCHWVEGRCLSYAGATAYHLWLGLLRGAIGATLDQSPEAVTEALQRWVAQVCPASQEMTFPYLARLLALPLNHAWQQRLDGMDAQALQRRTFAALEQVLVCATALRPIIMVCEDLHWADPSSLVLLEHLLPLVERTPLLLICLLRSEPDSSRTTCFLRKLAQQNGQHLEVELRPLSDGESEVLLASLLGQTLPARLAWRILGQAEGNPFYLEEIIRALLANGALAQDVATGQYRLVHDVAEIAIPETLQSVLVARIDRLHDEERRVLQLASVIGRIFLHPVLAAIAGEVDDLDACLHSLEEQELIRAWPGGPELEYSFKHVLTQEAVYNGMLRRQRQECHRKTAEALERLFPERIGELLDLLAFHWELSDTPQRAVDVLLCAGDRARLAFSPWEAVDYYRRALRWQQQQGDDEGATRTLGQLGLVQGAAFDHEQANTARPSACAPDFGGGRLTPIPGDLRGLFEDHL